jgi:hypothetical protein
VAVAGAAALRNKLLGQLPPYSSQLFISNMAARAGLRLSQGQARTMGFLYRLAYGTGLGLVFGCLGGRYALRRPGATGAALGASIMLFELLTMPPLGITPPVSRWTRAERLLLIVHTAVYGQVAARMYRRAALSPAP